ncbi:hypothetical protein EMCRGX_G007824 [Ephydatia muelleri]
MEHVGFQRLTWPDDWLHTASGHGTTQPGGVYDTVQLKPSSPVHFQPKTRPALFLQHQCLHQDKYTVNTLHANT